MNVVLPPEFYAALPFAVAFGLAAAVPIALLLQHRLTANIAPEWRLAAILVIVGAGALMSVALTRRDLNESDLTQMVRLTREDFEEGFAASRWLTLLLLGTAFVEIARGWVRARATDAVDPARPLLRALLLYFLGTIVVQAFASEVPGFSYKSLYLPFVLAAVYFLRVERMDVVTEAARWIVFVLCAASLAAAAVRPDFVLHRPVPGVLPGIDWRLFGLTSHANTLGPVALIGVLLELHSPARSRITRHVRLLTALGVLVLTQSKTAWAAALAVLIVVHVPLALAPDAASDPGRAFRRAVWTLVGCILAILAVVGAATASNVFDTLVGKVDLDTFTGRTRIWELTLDAWRDNVLFGYGPEIWGLRRRLEFDMLHVGQAHNQIVQTLGEAGLAGLLLLLIYAGALLATAIRHFAASRGIVLTLLVLLLARWISEAPMRSESVLSWTTFAHVLLVALAFQYARQAPGRRPADTQRSDFRDTVPLAWAGARTRWA